MFVGNTLIEMIQFKESASVQNQNTKNKTRHFNCYLAFPTSFKRFHLYKPSCDDMDKHGAFFLSSTGRSHARAQGLCHCNALGGTTSCRLPMKGTD